MVVRQLKCNEILDALKLIWKVFSEQVAPDYTSEGIATFKALIENEEEMLRKDFYGAFIDKHLVGVIATKNVNHIMFYFVCNENQNKGIGKELFEYLLERNLTDIYTVNSSPYAIEIYKKLGFVVIEEQQQVHGIKFTPMKYFEKHL